MSLIDERTINNLREFAPALLQQLIDSFIRNAALRVEQARVGLEHGDLDEIRRSGHSLKSTAATVGAATLAETARRLEAAAVAGDLELLNQLGPRLASDYELSIAELQKYAGEQ